MDIPIVVNLKLIVFIRIMFRLNIVAIFSLFGLIILFLIFLNYSQKVEAHGEKHEADIQEDKTSSPELPYIVEEGKLPGITWADDIHPIFIRNKCGECHTRTKEVYVDELPEFALGIINSDDPSDPYYSYHELVYAEGPPQIQKGENLRNGQCCWPVNYSPEDQRRIWIGRSERSVLMRKLEGDYYDWNNPPRYLEDSLSLQWGIPMPMFHPKEKVKGDGYKVRSILSRIIFKISIWFGQNSAELYKLPPRISVKDRALLHYWINHSEQTKDNKTTIAVYVVDKKDQPVQGKMVQLIGNHNSLEQAEVKDIIEARTNKKGIVELSFPEWSVISLFWFVAEKNESKTPKFIPLKVKIGETNTIKLIL